MRHLRLQAAFPGLSPMQICRAETLRAPYEFPPRERVAKRNTPSRHKSPPLPKSARILQTHPRAQSAIAAAQRMQRPLRPLSEFRPPADQDRAARLHVARTKRVPGDSKRTERPASSTATDSARAVSTSPLHLRR